MRILVLHASIEREGIRNDRGIVRSDQDKVGRGPAIAARSRSGRVIVRRRPRDMPSAAVMTPPSTVRSVSLERLFQVLPLKANIEWLMLS